MFHNATPKIPYFIYYEKTTGYTDVSFANILLRNETQRCKLELNY